MKVFTREDVVAMDEPVTYQTLDATRVTETITVLSERIHERFPESGLYKVSQQLSMIGKRAQEQANWMREPVMGLRLGVGVLIGVILLAIGASVATIGLTYQEITLIDFIQLFEAAINDIVLVCIAIFFLGTLETRFKRHKALKAIHELRSVAHVIDMHQLTKDPMRMHWEMQGLVESKHQLTPFELTRYLDYCSEMLSMVGKISVLYVQRFEDPVVLSAVNEIESLTTGLSRKIWQKLMVIQQHFSVDYEGITPSTV